MKTRKDSLCSEIRKGIVSRSYFFSGTNTYIIEEILQVMREEFLNTGFEPFDLEKFDAGERSFLFDGFKRALSTPPMASSKRMIILERVDKLVERERKELLSLLENSPESSVLVMIASPDMKKTSFYKKLSSVSWSGDFKNLKKYTLEKWIREEVGKKGYTIDNNAILTIIEMLGNNQISVSNEIEKIMTYLGDSENISRDDVLKVLTSNMVSNVFDLTQAIGVRDCERSLGILNYLLEWGEIPERILAVLRRFFLRLKGIQYYTKKGLTTDTIAKKLGEMAFIVNKEIRYVKNFTPDDLKKRLKLLYEAEILMKTGGERDLVLTSLVYNLN
jgi:DNA polymerase-3 subunit delta